jgi:DNA-binding response OmpR family regulator
MSKSPQTILIVEDVKDNYLTAARALTYNNYQCVHAENGRHALDYLAEHDVDLILLDIMMPVMDGFETCNVIKNDARHATTPIIFLTALNDMDSVANAFEAGGVDYITKPFQRAELLARVKTHLSLRHLQLTQAQLIGSLHAKNQELKQQNQQLENITSLIVEYEATPLADMTKALNFLHEFCKEKEAHMVLNRLANLRDNMAFMLNSVLHLTTHRQDKV